jgi:translation initiation factor IF-1
MGKSSKKGRITASQRQEINSRNVSAAMDGDMEDVEFARVLKHLGAGHVRIILTNKREGIAKIKTALARRGSTPIVTDDIVVISGRDFETKSSVGPDGLPIEKVERFDIIGVLTRAQASKLEREGKIPGWFMATTEGAAESGDIFDYEVKEEELNIDDI